MDSLNITPISELEKAAKGEVIALPPFSEGSEFNARVRRLSMAFLVRAGKIPNPLLNKVYRLFSDEAFLERLQSGHTDKADKNSIKELNQFIDAVVNEALTEPSVYQLRKAGIELTEEQKMAIFNYIQGGVEALSYFRTKQSDIKDSDDVTSLPPASQPTT